MASTCISCRVDTQQLGIIILFHYPRGWQTLSVKCQTMNILGFEGLKACDVNTHLYYVSVKAASDKCKRMAGSQ